MSIAPIEDIIAAVARGEMVIMVDDEDRENEGDLIVAADAASTGKLGFMLRHTSGIICLSIVGERLDELELPMMVAHNTDVRRTAFTVSIDAAKGTTTGISAADRARTIEVVLDPSSKPEDLARPGHMYPLRYEPGGVLKRAGHTEAAVDLARLAGRYPAGVLAEVMNDDGTVARLPDLERFAKEHDLLIGTIADLIAYRRRTERLVQRVIDARLPTRHGEFRAIGYKSLVDEREHIALMMGEMGDGESVLTRVHSECLTGDVFGSQRCDCGAQLDAALARVAEEGRGVVLYIRGHEGRGIGLLHKLAAYQLQDEGLDTVEANVHLGLPVDARDYGVGAQILYDLGVRSMRLMTNNPKKRAGIEGYGLSILEQVPLTTTPTDENRDYLETKRLKLGHTLEATE
ncbi:MAG: bifunctional 3,4-dihydroxy-2-butanone-4-phosphate synthase/GTP cyclohydrolase II [Acidimicrobiales bacterium]|jgi:3,4-dihydroxy 2-butanone 4-phosphate synthase/GTP cyclohydrolase II|nr:bifunctional 3,4-dihydroxy-2-butanone-4-phosphate synthase/GTP cyclohydrolase II [Acidimicrobiales bacterium]HLV91071.1 bifunctional 3,4-dihydroxy-2-butanone-4-phosphate synthase/GTP cyclohydrolase II [Acidimicrobiia bacterium]